MTIQGTVYNESNGQPVEGATVEAWAGNLRIGATAADDMGRFTLELLGTPTELRFSSASFVPVIYKYPEAAGLSSFVLPPNVVEGEPVVIKSKREKKNGLLWWIVAAGAVLYLSNKIK